MLNNNIRTLLHSFSNGWRVTFTTAGKMLFNVCSYVLASIVKIGAICNLKGKVLRTMPNISLCDIHYMLKGERTYSTNINRPKFRSTYQVMKKKIVMSDDGLS